MPKVRLLAPATDKDGNPHAAEEVVDVDDETATDWRASGKASLIEDEERQAKQEGHYTDVVGRDDTAPLAGSGSPQPGPQQETKDKDDDDRPKPKGRK